MGKDLVSVHRLTTTIARLIGRVAQVFRHRDPHEKLEKKSKVEVAKERWLTLGHARRPRPAGAGSRRTERDGCVAQATAEHLGTPAASVEVGRQ